MAYIGKQPVVGNFQVCDAITVVNGQAAYTMQVSSANVEPENANHMLVSLNGILQKPGSSFTISGATITFASNLATGDVIDFIILLGNVLDIGTPSDDSVGAAQIKADLISGTTALASTPADTDEFLVSDAGTLKRIDYSLIKGGGKIAQIVSTNKTDTFSESIATEGISGLVTGLTVDITPSLATSKILVFLNMGVGADGEHGMSFQLYRDSTQIDMAAASSSRPRRSKGPMQQSGGTSYITNMSTNYLDSPSSTSELTYGVKIGHTSSSTKTIYVNRSHDDNDDLSYGRNASTITVMEVLA
jgi:hypothetical protein